MQRPFRARLPVLAIGLSMLLLVPAPAGARGAVPDASTWSWPVRGGVLAERFVAPPDPYSAGHRGIDIATGDDPVVRAPADGVVAFAGMVVDRPVLTIDHGAGLVSSYEPLVALVAVGDVVAAGAPIGSVGTGGGHAAPGSLHVGVRQGGAYIDPLTLMRPPARAVLLPCC